MGPDFLEMMGLIACLLAVVGVIVWIISSIEVWSEIGRIWTSVREFEEFDEKWADDVIGRIAALEIAAKRKAAK